MTRQTLEVIVFGLLVCAYRVAFAQGTDPPTEEQPPSAQPSPEPITLDETPETPEPNPPEKRKREHQPATAPAAAPEDGAVVEPASPPPRKAGERYHDGLYLRFGLGYGHLFAENSGATRCRSSAGSSTCGEAMPGSTLKGDGLAANLLMIGATPFPGFVVGGGMFVNGLANPTVEVSGKSHDFKGKAALLWVGPFVDGFPDPEAGYHVGGGVGYADLNPKPDDWPDETKPAPAGSWQSEFCPKDAQDCRYPLFVEGMGYLVFAGYDAFIAREWSLGGYAQLMIFGSDQNYGSTSGWSFAFMATALYH